MSIRTPNNPSVDRRFRYEPMIPATVCFAVGICVDRFADVRTIFLFIATILAWIGWFSIHSRWPRKTKVACCFLFLMIASSGALWHHARWNWYPKTEIGITTGENFNACVLRGTLITEPVRVAAAASHPTLDTMTPKERVRFRLKINSVRDKDQWKNASGTVSVSMFLSKEQTAGTDPIQLPNCGTQVEIVGSLGGGRATRNPGQFDFATFSRSKGQLAAVFVDSTDGVSEFDSDAVASLGFRAKLRSNIDNQLHTHLPDQQAAFASAVLLGNRDQMDIEVRDRFLKTGASHLLAISGLHVGILASGFLLLLRLGFVSRRNCLYLTIAFVLSYAWLVEFRPTVLRAAILICVMCGARLLGKRSLSWGSLTTALMLVLLVNPMDLFSLGTQLSFLAISSIIIGKQWIFKAASQDPIDQLIARTRSTPVRIAKRIGRDVRAAFCVSLLIWTLGIPLVAYQFHSVALIAPLLNPLLLLPMALALYSGMATITCGTLAPATAFAPAAVCSLSLGCIQNMIDVGADQQAGHFWTCGPTGIAVIVFYLGVFVFAVFPRTKVPTKWCLALAVAWLVFGWLIPHRAAQLQRVADAKLKVTIIDVRHGSAALLELPDGRNILFDCGSPSGSSKAAETVSNLLWREGISRLDAVIVSHADVDHFNALPELIERFHVGAVWVSPSMVDDDAPSVRTLRSAIEKHNVSVLQVDEGSLAEFADTRLKISFLGPPSLSADFLDQLDDNELSLVAKIEFNGRSILLPGDVEKLGMESLLKQPIENVDVLVAAHHGSKNSDPQRFARWCKPDFVVASCGSGRFGDFQRDQFGLGYPCVVLSTDQCGAVRCTVNASGSLAIEHWNGEGWTEVNRL